MLKSVKHSARTQQPKLGGLAYWCAKSVPMFSYDRSEINIKVREGWDS